MYGMSPYDKALKKLTNLQKEDPKKAIKYLEDLPDLIKQDPEMYEKRYLLENLRRTLIKTLPEGSVKPSDISSAVTSSKEIPEEELWDLYDRFSAMPEEKREKHLLGKGFFKNVYKLPDSDLVLKTSRKVPDDIFAGRDESTLIKDYLDHKLTSKNLPKESKLIENPILLKKPKKEIALIQRKLIVPDVLNRYKYYDDSAQKYLNDKIDPALLKALENLNASNFEKEYLENIGKEFRPSDVHSGNIGLDPRDLSPKIFDAMASESVNRKDLYGAMDKIKKILTEARNPKIYRAIAPVLAKGGIAAASGLASLAAEAADVESLNDNANANRLLDIQEGAARFKKEMEDRKIPEAPKTYAQDLIDEVPKKNSYSTLRKMIR